MKKTGKKGAVDDDIARPLFGSLRTTFLQIKMILLPRYHTSNVKAEQRVKAVANLLEQLEACTQVRQRDLPAINDLDHVKELLAHKIRTTMDEDIDELKQCLTGMNEERVQIEGLVDEVQRVISQTESSELMLATATRPSVTNMLEWLQYIKRHLSQDYHSKSLFADSVLSCDSKKAVDVSKHWNDSIITGPSRSADGLFNADQQSTYIFSDIWPYLQFFLHDDNLPDT